MELGCQDCAQNGRVSFRSLMPLCHSAVSKCCEGFSQVLYPELSRSVDHHVFNLRSVISWAQRTAPNATNNCKNHPLKITNHVA